MVEYIVVAVVVGVVVWFFTSGSSIKKELQYERLLQEAQHQSQRLLDIQQIDIDNMRANGEYSQIKIKELYETIDQEQEKFKKLLSQKKSSETRLGMVGEQLVPFLDGFKYNPRDLQFLGQPIDYILFDFDLGKIVFIEIKTGNSKLSKNQKIVRDIIKTGRVYFEQIRLGTDGTVVKTEENLP